jgi:hypothetical protein
VANSGCVGRRKGGTKMTRGLRRRFLHVVHNFSLCRLLFAVCPMDEILPFKSRERLVEYKVWSGPLQVASSPVFGKFAPVRLPLGTILTTYVLTPSPGQLKTHSAYIICEIRTKSHQVPLKFVTYLSRNRWSMRHSGVLEDKHDSVGNHSSGDSAR